MPDDTVSPNVVRGNPQVSAPPVAPLAAPKPSGSRKAAVVKAAKEIARIATLGAVSALLSYGATNVASLPPDSVYAVILTVLLKGGDKYIHENQAIPAKGIVPF